MTFRMKSNTRSGKIECDVCGQSGYPGGRWMLKHGSHVTCECGKVVPGANLNYHLRHCRLRQSVG